MEELSGGEVREIQRGFCRAVVKALAAVQVQMEGMVPPVQDVFSRLRDEAEGLTVSCLIPAHLFNDDPNSDFGILARFPVAGAVSLSEAVRTTSETMEAAIEEVRKRSGLGELNPGGEGVGERRSAMDAGAEGEKIGGFSGVVATAGGLSSSRGPRSSQRQDRCRHHRLPTPEIGPPFAKPVSTLRAEPGGAVHLCIVLALQQLAQRGPPVTAGQIAARRLLRQTRRGRAAF